VIRVTNVASAHFLIDRDSFYSTASFKSLNDALWELPVPDVSSVAQPVIIAILSLGTAGHRASQDAPPAEPVLEITGQAARKAETAAFYAFTPTVVQNGERKLHFSIRNKPAWARFGLRHGTLYGTPAAMNAGVYSNIVITVSDGLKSVELAPFSITVADGTPPVVARTP